MSLILDLHATVQRQTKEIQDLKDRLSARISTEKSLRQRFDTLVSKLKDSGGIVGVMRSRITALSSKFDAFTAPGGPFSLSQIKVAQEQGICTAIRTGQGPLVTILQDAGNKVAAVGSQMKDWKFGSIANKTLQQITGGIDVEIGSYRGNLEAAAGMGPMAIIGAISDMSSGWRDRFKTLVHSTPFNVPWLSNAQFSMTDLVNQFLNFTGSFGDELAKRLFARVGLGSFKEFLESMSESMSDRLDTLGFSMWVMQMPFEQLKYEVQMYWDETGNTVYEVLLGSLQQFIASSRSSFRWTIGDFKRTVTDVREAFKRVAHPQLPPIDMSSHAGNPLYTFWSTGVNPFTSGNINLSKPIRLSRSGNIFSRLKDMLPPYTIGGATIPPELTGVTPAGILQRLQGR
jgi:hypothetical protein